MFLLLAKMAYKRSQGGALQGHEDHILRYEGEKSLSGGDLGLFEGGAYNTLALE